MLIVALGRERGSAIAKYIEELEAITEITGVLQQM